jgi:hypothetical protein
MLNKFSRGEAAYGEMKLKNRIIFLLDEFPVLGAFPFLSKTLGILAGYGITFYIVVQAINQIIDLYGQHHTFLDNCKTVCVYAPGKIEDAKNFTEMIGKESVVKESLSASGSRYAVAFNNLNASNQEVARDLMNPDELMKLPPDEALILNQGMPAYIAKKVVYYEDERFRNNAYSRREVKVHKKFLFIPIPFCYRKEKKTVTTGFAPPATRKELELEIAGLPSNMKKTAPLTAMPAKSGRAISGLGPAVNPGRPLPMPDAEPDTPAEDFNPVDYIESYYRIEAFTAPSIVPFDDDTASPPTVIPWQEHDFGGTS